MTCQNLQVRAILTFSHIINPLLPHFLQHQESNTTDFENDRFLVERLYCYRFFLTLPQGSIHHKNMTSEGNNK